MGKMININGSWIPESVIKKEEEAKRREAIRLEEQKLFKREGVEMKDEAKPRQKEPWEIYNERKEKEERERPKICSKKKREYTEEEKEYMERYGVPFFPDEERLKIDWIRNAVEAHYNRIFRENMKYGKKIKE